MRIIIFGPPGAGKGTQAEKIKNKYDIPHLSTGEIFRNAIKNETNLGHRVKSMLDNGELVPDETVDGLVREELEKPAYQDGYILDGFPRTETQAQYYDNFLEARDESLTAFILLEVPRQTLIDRILNRGEGRSDDNGERVKKRLDIFWNKTIPVKEHYQKQGLVKNIDGTKSIEDIFEEIRKVVE